MDVDQANLQVSPLQFQVISTLGSRPVADGRFSALKSRREAFGVFGPPSASPRPSAGRLRNFSIVPAAVCPALSRSQRFPRDIVAVTLGTGGLKES